METLLEIIGGITLTVIAVVGIAIIWYFKRMQKAFDTITEESNLSVVLTHNLFWCPTRLLPTPEFDETDEDFVEQKERWSELGFLFEGYFTDNRKDACFIYKHKASNCIGVQLESYPEMCHAYAFKEKGQFTKCGYSRFGANEKIDADSRLILSPEDDLQTLLAPIFESELSDKTADFDWKKALHKALEKELEHWSHHFVLTEGQLREWLETDEQTDDTETLETFRRRFDYALSEAQMPACRQHFLETSDLTAAQWEAIRESVVVVIDNLYQSQVIELLGQAIELPQDLDEERNPKRKVSGRDLFARLNQTLPQAKQYQKIGKIDTPIPADVYALTSLVHAISS